MSSNEFVQFLGGSSGLSGAGGRSVLDETVRTVLLRYSETQPGVVAPAVEFLQAVDPRGVPGGFDDPAPVPDPVGGREHHLLRVLERERSEVASLAHFAHRVDVATGFLCIAFERAGVRDFEPSRPQRVVQAAGGVGSWYASQVNGVFARYRDLRSALLHSWTVPAELEKLRLCAFLALSDLTPADSQLRSLFATDRVRAFKALVAQLDIRAEQLKAAIQLAVDVVPVSAAGGSAAGGSAAATGGGSQLDLVQEEILRNAGEPLSLTSAAARLGVSRQALHKRIQVGSALGVMRGTELVVPAAQFVERDGRTVIVDGIREVVGLFDQTGAGRWSALQFLTEIDPLLRAKPLETLERGDVSAVVTAARGYLSIDEA